MSLKLAIVLPTLNERDNIAPVIAQLEQALGADGWEAIFVDDNSADGTGDLLRATALADPRVRVIERFGRRGLASAAIEGMCSTAAPFVALMDADLQHDPALLPRMLAAVESGEADIAVASRFVAGGSAEGLSSKGREAGSRMANRLSRLLTGMELTDPMSGFFLLRSERLRRSAPRLSGIGFKILLDILMTLRRKVVVKEFPLKFAQRGGGESKLDRAVAFEFLIGLYDRHLGRILPTRFALFGTIGALGVVVHMTVLAAFLDFTSGEHLLFGRWITRFDVGQTAAAIVAMSFNFVLNNFLTYADTRLKGAFNLLKGWLRFAVTCSVGMLANIGAAAALVRSGVHPYPAALVGIVIGSVWNYALSSKFVWGRYK
ncbi:MAG TPA: glycosyltransferase family 2 protein [Sphingomonadaceae bacterium]